MIRVILLVLSLSVVAATARAAEYWVSPDDEVFGEVKVVKARYEDTFVSLAREHNVGYESLRRANPGVDAWLPGEGTEVTIPTGPLKVDFSNQAQPYSVERSVKPEGKHTRIMIGRQEDGTAIYLRNTLRKRYKGSEV